VSSPLPGRSILITSRAEVGQVLRAPSFWAGQHARQVEHAAADAGGDPGRLPLLSSFSFEALSAAQACAPWLPRGFLIDRIGPGWQARCAELGVMAVHTNHKTLSPSVAAEVKAAGYGLFCYTVNDPDEARLLRSWGVDSFCTDRIDLIGPFFT
jgi:glycerophosphoryl diester phosphodiesterase